jgi:hypothetical protein
LPPIAGGVFQLGSVDSSEKIGSKKRFKKMTYGTFSWLGGEKQTAFKQAIEPFGKKPLFYNPESDNDDILFNLRQVFAK